MHFKKTLKKERQVKTMAKKKIGIIGGGISGAGLAYHLSLYEGEADVTVFEKDTIGGASTAKSAGTVCLFDDSLKNRYWDVRLYGFESYLKMEEEEKGSAGFDKTGTLVVATNEEVEKVIKTGIALAKAADIQESILQIKTVSKKSFQTFLQKIFLEQDIQRMTDILMEQ